MSESKNEVQRYEKKTKNFQKTKTRAKRNQICYHVATLVWWTIAPKADYVENWKILFLSLKQIKHKSRKQIFTIHVCIYVHLSLSNKFARQVLIILCNMRIRQLQWGKKNSGPSMPQLSANWFRPENRNNIIAESEITTCLL